MSVYIPTDKLSIENLSISLSDKILIENIDLYVSESEMIYIYSKDISLAQLLVRSIHTPSLPSSGVMKFMNEYLKQPALSKAQRNTIGLIVADWELFPDWTVNEQLKFAIDYAPKRIELKEIDILLEEMDLSDLKDKAISSLTLDQYFLVKYMRVMLLRPSLILFGDSISQCTASTQTKVINHLAAYLKETAAAAILVTDDISVATHFPARTYELDHSGIQLK